MLSAFHLRAPSLALARPARGHMVVSARSRNPRAGDEGGELQQFRRSKPRLPPPLLADEEETFEPDSPLEPQGSSIGTANGSSTADLIARIRGTKSGRKVVQVVKEAGPQCDAFIFSAAINQLGKLHQLQPKPINQSAFAELLEFAEQHPTVLNHVAVVQTVWAGGVLQHQLAVQQQEAWQELLLPVFFHPELQPKELANSLWGWSVMGLQLHGQTAAAAEAAVVRLAAGMNAKDVCDILVAYAKGTWEMDKASVETLVGQLEAVLPKANGHVVANSLLALFRLGWPLDGSLAEAAAAAVQRTAWQMVPRDVAITLSAYANAGWQISVSQAAPLLGRLEQMMPLADPHSLANCLWGASKLGWPLEGSLAAAAEAAIQLKAGEMTAQAVASTLWAFANAGWQLDSVPAAALLKQFECMLPEAEPQAVGQGLWAAAKLGLQLSSNLKAALVRALPPIIPDATSHILSNVLWASGKFDWSPGRPILTAAAMAMQQLLAAGDVEVQHVRNFMWGLAELQKQGNTLPPTRALLEVAAGWADSRWDQLPGGEAVDLCYNLARLGHRPGRKWIERAIKRCLQCIAAGDVAGAYFSTFIWACSRWGHRLQRSELERLVPAAVDNNCSSWEAGIRGGGLVLTGALIRQGFCVGPDFPAATAALEDCLLPLVISDLDSVMSGRVRPKVGALSYLASWAGNLAAIGLRLPEQQLQELGSYIGQHVRNLQQQDRRKLQSAFEAWGYQPGLAMFGKIR